MTYALAGSDGGDKPPVITPEPPPVEAPVPDKPPVQEPGSSPPKQV